MRRDDDAQGRPAGTRKRTAGRPNARLLLAPLLLAFAMGLPASEAAPQAIGRPEPAARLETSFALDAAVLNERIADTPPARKALMTNPVSLVHELIGGSSETPSVTIELRSEASEGFGRVSVVAIRDGFQDDSVRGDWHRFSLVRSPRGIWSVIEARKAWRCWRGSIDVYTARKCP